MPATFYPPGVHHMPPAMPAAAMQGGQPVTMLPGQVKQPKAVERVASGPVPMHSISHTARPQRGPAHSATFRQQGHPDQLSAVKTTMPASIDSTARSIATSTSTASTGPGSDSDATMQRKLSSVEGSLKEVDILLKKQLSSQQPAPESMEDRCAQMREEILRMQKSREKIEARVQSIADLMQEEKLEHEAKLQSFQKDLSQLLKTLNKGLEDSVSTSMNLMKVKLVETEKLLKTLIKQLNSSYTPALNEAKA
ncbi:unnamed protein product [Symbiodinium sp. CCMP2456]|nr:unnamed protein product [Symbiodinium sp. CCMP2456]